MVPHKVPDNECFCEPCRRLALDALTIYQKGGILPPNLALYYGVNA
jgi:hypothetical protein